MSQKNAGWLLPGPLQTNEINGFRGTEQVLNTLLRHSCVAHSVPRPGQTPNRWQQGVGLAVAEAYGSNLDPTTFLCIGSGTPIGYLNEHFEPSEAERKLWGPVDRDRGDNLLVLNWSPDPPPGWIDED